MTQFVSITLPSPISTNALWRPVKTKSGARMTKTPDYRAWKVAAGWELKAQKPGKVAGYYGLRIQVEDGLRIDLGNCEKAVSDLLQEHGVIENDKLCRRIEIEWSDAVEGMNVLVASTKGPSK